MGTRVETAEVDVSEVAKRRIHVVGAVLTRGRTVLAAQRSAQMSLPGKWEFPGGKIEPGESPKRALAREIGEELRCQIEVGDLMATTEYEYEFGTVILTTFTCTLIAGTPQLVEHSAVRWIPVAELDQLDWAPADVPTVRRVMQDLA